MPEERRKEGILVLESVVNNLSVANLAKFCAYKTFLQFGKEKKEAQRLIQDLGIKTPNELAKVKTCRAEINKKWRSGNG